MTIGQVLNFNAKLRPLLTSFGMHCLGCPMSRMETLEQAAMVHGVDVDAMVEELNKHM